MTTKTIKAAVVWEQGPVEGRVEVYNGKPARMRVAGREDRVDGASFFLCAGGSRRLELEIDEAAVLTGANATRVTVNVSPSPFTFFLRDVTRANPIFIPSCGVAVTTAGDRRTFSRIGADVRKKGRLSIQRKIEKEPEETFESACAANRNLKCPTWLGLSRDMRIFEVGYHKDIGYWGYVQPRYHTTLQSAPETENRSYGIGFVLGPGASCRSDIERRLEEGCLPILRSVQHEDDVDYDLVAFATLETRPLSVENLRGSEWEACYPNTGGNMLKQEDREKIKDLVDAEMRKREEETVCWVRIRAVNNGAVPHYAWLKAPSDEHIKFDAATGFSAFSTGRVVCVSLLDGRPLPNAEMAVLLQPGQSIVCDMLIPHQALPPERARNMAGRDFDEHLSACRRFWKGKLAGGASISVPEPAIDERIRAGLLHCDIVALGKEPAGPVLATIGWYSPIGSESAPIIQFFDSMGWHKLAERSLEFFLARQRDDGFIQNFGGYQLETGPALWTMGEHFRYTRDTEWVARIKPKLIRACDFLLAWRERNKKDEFRGKGYGLLDGKVADPEDFFHSFMLNALSHLGIKRVAEMLEQVDPGQSQRLAKEAAEFRKDIRTAFYESLARSPAIPLDDGTWMPTTPPWAEYSGPLALFADGGSWFTHGAFGGRDSLIGSLYLVISEVLDPKESGTDAMLKTHQQLFTVRNAGLSQPYYCRHDHIHIVRDEVKEFLKTYYNQFAALQDRETYTFWEHYYYASQHKTHEEGWFLMQTRWMLWMEHGDTIRFLRAIPRRWLENGKEIRLERIVTYFGAATLKVRSRLANRCIEAEVGFDGKRAPREVVIRLPHPKGFKPVRVEGGLYDAATESVRISPFKGKAKVRLSFR